MTHTHTQVHTLRKCVCCESLVNHQEVTRRWHREVKLRAPSVPCARLHWLWFFKKTSQMSQKKQTRQSYDRVLHLLASLIAFRCSCWSRAELAVLPHYTSCQREVGRRPRLRPDPACLYTQPGWRYAMSHTEERAAVTHNDKLSEWIKCGCLMLLYNVCA